ncbi:hypothetical protein P4O66_021289, partial [Electrophorus voltai]
WVKLFLGWAIDVNVTLFSCTVGALHLTPNVTDMSPYPVLTIPTEIRAVQQTQQVFAQHMVQAERSRVTMLSQVPLGDGPTVTICPHCQQHITTIVDYKPGAAAWGMCCLLTLF